MDEDIKLGLLNIGTASEYLGVSIDTLRRWEKKGRIKPLRSPGGHRYYSKADLDNLFGKRYSRDEETIRRTNEELGGKTSEEQTLSNPIVSVASEIQKEEGVSSQPQDLLKNAPQVPEIPRMYVAPEENIMAVERTSPVSDLPHVEQPKENTPPPVVLETSQEDTLSNVLIPQKDNNLLTEEEIEKRINTIIRKDEKKNTANIVLGIFALLLLLGNIFLVYIWFTTSRIASPLP